MKPTLGRIVLFHFDRSSNRGRRTRPAIVTNVHGDGSIDVEVFGDVGAEDGIGKYHGNVPQGPIEQDAGDHCWTWPPREAAHDQAKAAPAPVTPAS